MKNPVSLLLIFGISLQVGHVNAQSYFEAQDYDDVYAQALGQEDYSHGDLPDPRKPVVPNVDLMSPEMIRLKKLFVQMKNRSGSSFNVSVAEKAIIDLTKLGDHPSVPLLERSEAYTVKAGFEGKIAEKLGVRGGMAYIRKSMESFKTALKLDQNNADAAYGYAAIIDGMSQKSGLVRKFLEMTLNVSLYSECKQSINLLKGTENLGPEFRELKSDLGQFCG